MSALSGRMISDILAGTLPSYQATSTADGNLGYGFLFYALARLLRPKNVVVVGSKAGFSVVCFAIGLKENQGALIERVGCYETSISAPNAEVKVHLVDPSFSHDREGADAWYGIGFWDDPAKVDAHWRKYGVEDYVRHHKMTSIAFCESGLCPDDLDLLYIDGDHSYSGIKGDFSRFHAHLKRDALILAHDVDPTLSHEFPEAGGYQALSDLDPDLYEVFRFPVYPGMALVRTKK